MPDIIAPGLRVLFCGINPSVYSVVVGHHFARPGNRFWPALFAGGFTPHRFSPSEDGKLLDLGFGITNVAEKSSVAAADLTREEIETGARELENRVLRFEPQVLAILGIGAYRTGFSRPKATLGLQNERIGQTQIWVLPNPSGLNAHYHPPQLARLFGELKRFAE
ncbi:G/U mismatch-specific uracil-DNA glycosylase [Abditibacterium utsteinense]|uniref:G/U mismatch-specific uracil-DNA glycosylase n=1 Tax=Abditibacterium utsteinense TaxID=1960156 RepID=A0A2S8SVH0_9BACT|nr:G/U mismatch-specific uracil-DNA glycosylase [Abditibacterium utsteinense]